MWIQAVAIILPRVQAQYSSAASPPLVYRLSADQSPPNSVPDGQIGALFSSMFAGMMIGAIGWGTCKCPRSLRFGRL